MTTHDDARRVFEWIAALAEATPEIACRPVHSRTGFYSAPDDGDLMHQVTFDGETYWLPLVLVRMAAALPGFARDALAVLHRHQDGGCQRCARSTGCPEADAFLAFAGPFAERLREMAVTHLDGLPAARTGGRPAHP